MIRYEHDMTPQEYVDLRDSVGWRSLSLEQARRGLEHTTFLVVAREGESAVGMARLLYDFGYTAYITDTIVRPEYQKKGIGTEMMNQIIEFVKDNATEGEFLSFVLVSAKGKEGFYETLGFQKRPNDHLGSGMYLRLNE